MQSLAVVLEAPRVLGVRPVELLEAGEEDVVVQVRYSGISTGTERLLYMGQMPDFPGMGYPLIPGYESVGEIVAQGARAGRSLNERVFVAGSRGFKQVRGLFGGAAAYLVVPSARAIPVPEHLDRAQGILLALAATAYRAVTRAQPPQLIVGHGVVGRLAARLTCALAATPPIVWEEQATRRDGTFPYSVLAPGEDLRRDYQFIMDASGDAALIDALIPRMAPQGVLVLAGFYTEPIRFDFVPAFMRESTLQISAEWKSEDLAAVIALIQAGRLSLDGLITHFSPIDAAAQAYETAFGDPTCLKMVLEWQPA